MAAPVAIAAELLTSRTVRRMLACGCLGAAAVVALPVFLLVSVLSGAFSVLDGGGAASNQVDGAAGGSADLIVGAGQPLLAGRFAVSQGFGCTNVAGEPPPPAPYSCPPDATHPSYIRFHTGIDLAAAIGQPVFAVAAGTVRVLYSPTGFGLHILLTPVATASGTTAVYLYGHLSGAVVGDGEAVRAGAPIGFVGSTGNSTGPHLHFEVDIGGVPVNPCSTFPAGYLTPPGVAAADCLAWQL